MLIRILLFACLIASLVTLLAYGHDKRAARLDRWRVPEATLHLFELCGGWPGGILGRRLFRHKTWKRGFLIRSWAIIALHGAGWAFMIWLTLRNA